MHARLTRLARTLTHQTPDESAYDCPCGDLMSDALDTVRGRLADHKLADHIPPNPPPVYGDLPPQMIAL